MSLFSNSCLSGHILSIKRDIPFNGGVIFERVVRIIASPVTEENKAEIYKILERISNATLENWIEKYHSVRSIESESIDKNIPKNVLYRFSKNQNHYHHLTKISDLLILLSMFHYFCALSALNSMVTAKVNYLA